LEKIPDCQNPGRSGTGKSLKRVSQWSSILFIVDDEWRMKLEKGV